METRSWQINSSISDAALLREQRIRRSRKKREDRQLHRQRLPAVRQSMRQSRREGGLPKLRQKKSAGERNTKRRPPEREQSRRN